MNGKKTTETNTTPKREDIMPDTENSKSQILSGQGIDTGLPIPHIDLKLDTSPILTSNPLGEQSKPLKRSWKTPKNIKEFASQCNQVTTMILNEEMDLDRARTFSAVARTVAQAMTSETNKARFLKVLPDLEFEEDLFQ